jgi:hypothetical protein
MKNNFNIPCIVAIIVFLILIFSCNNNEKQDSNKNTDNSYINLFLDETKRETELKMSSFFSSVKIIPLELTDNSMLGDINNLQIFEDKFIIFDKTGANSVFVFNKKGEFLFEIGSKGSGPGEYSEISDFTIDYEKKLIFILDNQRQIINVYQLTDAKYLYNLNIKNEDMASFHIQHFDGGLYADVFYQNKSKKKKMHLLRSIDIETGKTKKLFLEVDKYNKGFNEMSFTGKGVFFSRKDDPVYMQLFMDTLVTLADNKVTPYLILNSKELVNKEDLEIAQNTNGNYSNITADLFKINKYHTLENFIESNEFILIKCYYKNMPRYLYYDKIKNQTGVYNILQDDILFKDFDMKSNRIRINFLCEDITGLYASIPNRNIPNLIDAFKKNELNYEQSNNSLSTISEDSNPILLFYEYK